MIDIMLRIIRRIVLRFYPERAYDKTSIFYSPSLDGARKGKLFIDGMVEAMLNEAAIEPPQGTGEST